MITFLPLLFLPFMGDLGAASTTFSDTDFLAVGIVVGYITKFLGIAGVIALVIIIGALGILLQRKANQKVAEK
ncbi:PTS system sugar-specific permease component family protein [Staphylococcus aureus]|nr:PTS system sugar-specific permease component family protein [Staphylococcus aureus]